MRTLRRMWNHLRGRREPIQPIVHPPGITLLLSCDTSEFQAQMKRVQDTWNAYVARST